MSRHNEQKAELYGRSGMNPFIRHTSAVRHQMTDGFRSQSLVTTGCTPKAHYSGVEDEMGKYTFSVRFPCNAEIYRIIHKDIETRDGGIKNPLSIIIYRDIDKNEYDYLEVPRYHSIHQYFGFLYQRTPAYSTLRKGEIVKAGTIIADSPTIARDGTNCYGTETNYASMTMPESTEDGTLVSEEWLQENRIFCVETRMIRFGGNEFLVNIHGDKENYMGIPPIGSIIPDNGLIFASRKLNNITHLRTPTREEEEDCYLSSIFLHPKFMKNYEYGDTLIYGKPGALVTDVTIYRGKGEKAQYPELYDKQVKELHRRGYNFHKQIIDTEQELVRVHGKNNTAWQIAPKLKRLFIDAYAEIQGSGETHRPKHNIFYDKLPVKHWVAIVEYCYWITPQIGYKIADEQGCKHIIVGKKPRVDMPVDTDGNIADVVADPQAVLSRNNVSRFIIQYLNACSKRIGTKITELMKENKAQEAWEMLYDYYTTITDQIEPILEEAGSRFNPLDELNDVVRNGTARPYVPLDNGLYDSYFDMINILEEKFPPCYGPVTYRGNTGRLVTTKRPVIIGSLYTMILEKDGRSGTAVGSSRLHGTFGIPAKPSSLANKVSLPGKESPVRMFGETEKRLTSAACGGMAMRLVDEYNSNVQAHRSVMEAIYSSENPTAIQNGVDWDKVKMSGGRMVRFIRTMFRSCGFELIESEY